MSLADGCSLPKRHLLKTNREFQQVYRCGRRFSGDGFTIISLPNARKQRRLGISVQKKIGHAVRRNRIKRLLREAFRLNRGLFPPFCDIVLAVRPGFSPKGLREVEMIVRAALQTATQQSGTEQTQARHAV